MMERQHKVALGVLGSMSLAGLAGGAAELAALFELAPAASEVRTGSPLRWAKAALFLGSGVVYIGLFLWLRRWL
ncbi:MAG: hypothetical protein ACOY4K_15880 [Pseudomonadota bacterium]